MSHFLSLRLLVYFLLGLFFSLLQSTSNDYEVLWLYLQNCCRAWPFLIPATATTVVPATIPSHLQRSCFFPCSRSALLNLASTAICENQVTSELKICNVSSFCLEKKSKSMPAPTRRKPASLVSPTLFSCDSPCPTHLSTHSTLASLVFVSELAGKL